MPPPFPSFAGLTRESKRSKELQIIMKESEDPLTIATQSRDDENKRIGRSLDKTLRFGTMTGKKAEAEDPLTRSPSAQRGMIFIRKE